MHLAAEQSWGLQLLPSLGQQRAGLPLTPTGAGLFADLCRPHTNRNRRLGHHQRRQQVFVQCLRPRRLFAICFTKSQHGDLTGLRLEYRRHLRQQSIHFLRHPRAGGSPVDAEPPATAKNESSEETDDAQCRRRRTRRIPVGRGGDRRCLEQSGVAT